MNSSDTERERLVVPQWLPFKVAVAQPELLAVPNDTSLVDIRPTERAFSEALSRFEAEPSPFLAADLVGIALRLGRIDAAQRLAEYVLSRPVVGAVATQLAQRVLGKVAKVAADARPVQAKIREAKIWVRRFPTDAIAWVEQARLYTIIGQKRPAERAIERALRLAPIDRFVVRAAIRFFVHRSNWERAHRVAGQAAKQTGDPWIVSQWISTGTQLGKVPPRFKDYFSSALAAPKPFHFSELIEACATQEVLSGSEKKAKRAFQHAWVEPPKTVITHSQWVLREKLPQLASIASIDFSKSAEAMAWVNLMRMDLLGAIQSAREWALEEPFSSNAFLHGSFVDTLREEYAEAEMLAREGLRANPGHHGLINNLAFALAGQNKLDAAESVLEPVKNVIAEDKDVALIATWGLVRMKKGDHTEGRKLYLRAVEKAKEQKDTALALRAVLNLLTAETDSGGTVDSALVATAAEALTKTSDARIIATAERLNKRLAANQSLFPNAAEKEAFSKFDRAVAQSATELRKVVEAAQKVAAPGAG